MNIALGFLKDILVQWRGHGWHMGPEMMGWGYGMGWIGMILMAAFWIAVIVGIIFLIRWLVISTSAGRRGEIDKEEFEEKKKDLA
jgi:putative membrane protein